MSLSPSIFPGSSSLSQPGETRSPPGRQQSHWLEQVAAAANVKRHLRKRELGKKPPVSMKTVTESLGNDCPAPRREALSELPYPKATTGDPPGASSTKLGVHWDPKGHRLVETHGEPPGRQKILERYAEGEVLHTLESGFLHPPGISPPIVLRAIIRSKQTSAEMTPTGHCDPEPPPRLEIFHGGALDHLASGGSPPTGMQLRSSGIISLHPPESSPPIFLNTAEARRHPPWRFQTRTVNRFSHHKECFAWAWEIPNRLGTNAPPGCLMTEWHPCSRGDPPGYADSWGDPFEHGPPGLGRARGDPPEPMRNRKERPWHARGDPPGRTSIPVENLRRSHGPPRQARSDPQSFAQAPPTYGFRSGPRHLARTSSHKDPHRHRGATGPPGTNEAGAVNCWSQSGSGSSNGAPFVHRQVRGGPPGITIASRLGCDPPRSRAGPVPSSHSLANRRGPPGALRAHSSLSAGRCRERNPDARPETERHDVARKPKPKSRKITPWL